MRHLWGLLGIKANLHFSHHPQASGQVDQANRTVITDLKIYAMDAYTTNIWLTWNPTWELYFPLPRNIWTKVLDGRPTTSKSFPQWTPRGGQSVEIHFCPTSWTNPYNHPEIWLQVSAPLVGPTYNYRINLSCGVSDQNKLRQDGTNFSNRCTTTKLSYKRHPCSPLGTLTQKTLCTKKYKKLFRKQFRK